MNSPGRFRRRIRSYYSKKCGYCGDGITKDEMFGETANRCYCKSCCEIVFLDDAYDVDPED